MISDFSVRKKSADLTKSFIVKAPAGSGKTTMLVDRFVRALSAVEEPEEVLAITFTRKAAEEMRTRVLAILSGTENGEALSTDTRKTVEKIRQIDSSRGWDLTVNPSRLAIMTIDAFCASIVQRTPSISDSFIPTRIEEDQQSLYTQAARRALSEISSKEHGGYVSRVLWRFDSDWSKLENLVAKVLGHRDLLFIQVGIDFDPSVIKNRCKNLVESNLEVCSSQISVEIKEDLFRLYNFSEANLAGKKAKLLRSFPDSKETDLDSWKRILDRLIFTKKNERRKRLTIANGFPAKGEENIVMRDRWRKALEKLSESKNSINLLRQVNNLPVSIQSQENIQCLEDVLKLVKLAAAHLNLIFSQRQAVDFTQLSLAAISALGAFDEPTDLSLKLDYRIQHILVDEFQDTSPTQLELIKLLVSGWIDDQSHSLFLVGDPMQSIYRFRKADANLFNRLFQSGRIENLPLERLTMISNFRSQSNLVAWINRLIPASLNFNESVSDFFVPQKSTVKGGSLPPYKLYNVWENSQVTEAEAVAHIVKDIHNNENDLNAEEKLSIGVLARSKNHLADIVKEFNESGIDFGSDELNSLGDSPVVQDLMSLTRALLHPADRVGWYAFFRAPWAGLNLETLTAMSVSPVLSDFWTDLKKDSVLEKKELRQLLRLKDIFLKTQALLKTNSLCDVVRIGWNAFGGSALYEDSDSSRTARKFFQVLDRVEKEGGLVTTHRIEKLLQTIFPDGSENEFKSVRVMTIHKAKGLEFDAVILPGIHRTVRSEPQSLLYWEDYNQNSSSREPLVATSGYGERDSLYDYLRDSESQKVKDEVIRLLYVALTRARKQVHLVGHLSPPVESKEEYSVKAPKGSFLDLMTPMILEEFLQSKAQIESNRVGSQKNRLVKRIELLKQESETLAETHKLVTTRTDFVDLDYDWASILARQIGIVTHEIFQNLDSLIFSDPTGILVERMLLYARNRYRSLGLSGKNLVDALKRTEDAACNMLGSERGRWLFDPGHRQVECELEIFSSEVEGFRRVVIDRTFVDKRGYRWIVDYKTGYHDGSDIENFLDSEMIRHRPQLDYYAHVLSRIETREIILGLYFPVLDRWKEWPYSSDEKVSN